ncbi:MAG: glutamine synthetase family protein [SAR324 cluster bacterium]|jgi:glutamine synthetase|nr:glutamine synthetase [SAR324 cluster bacterium]MCH2265837.1 glutamine synthetase family protein [SAR324 cluster bacterium]
MSDKSFEEANIFLEQYPDISEFDLLLPDMNAVLRGKRIQRKKLSSIFKKGIYFPKSVFAFDVTGETMEETGLGFESGDQDIPCFPVPETLKPVPWQKKRGQLLLRMFEEDDSPFYGNPREVLKTVCEKLADSGFNPVVALEMEFYLTEPKRRSGQPPQPARSPETGETEAEGQLFSLSTLDVYESFLNDISTASQSQNVPADTALAELAPGQFEINLHHVPDAVQACDHAVLLKRIIRSVARKHKMEATFMAKPYPQEAGSGMHVHVSLLDDSGKNLFQGKDAFGSPELRYAVQGLRSTLAESMLIFAPHANSFHRYRSGTYAPINSSWGYNNRTVSFRIPANDGPDMRIEHRLAGADANPYLLVGALLAGIHHGLSVKKMPPAPIEGNAYLQTDTELPRTWEQARNCFEQAEILPQYFGNDFCRLFSNLKLGEQSRFLSRIVAHEYDLYLKTV